MMRLAWLVTILCLLLADAALANAPRVAVIDLHGSLSSARADWADAQIDAAWKAGVAGIILDMDSTDGSMDAALQLERHVQQHAADLPIAAYVHNNALGPISLVAVACKPLAMAPGGSLGGAPPDAAPADFSAAAESAGRNPSYAAAFVAADSALPAVHLSLGNSLILTANQAKSIGYADVIAPDFPAVLAQMNSPSAQLVPVHWDTWTAIAWWVSRPWATLLILGLGLALIIAEMITWHSWGLAAVLGTFLVALTFAAHITVGAFPWAGAILFLAGVALLLLETHVFPGHGLAALAGLILIFLGLFFGLGGAQAGALSTAGSALLVTAGILAAFLAYLPRSPIWRRLSQPTRQSAAAGYIASQNYTEFVGQIGTAVTPLRPSGTAEVDGARLSVVTEGDFLVPGTPVQVIAVQGSRIVVQATEEPQRV